MPTPYTSRFAQGSEVRVRSRPDLERFAREWKYHDPLTSEQLAYAGSTATISEIGFYHGGDPLYKLQGVPGVWHEECLIAP